METVTINNVYALLQEINHRLSTIETEVQELRGEPGLRAEYIEKIKGIKKDGKFSHYKTIGDLRSEIETD
ncbi:MAG: hypothetical protein CVT88_05880 [Candidatus Altiarchaeales archaeon HGW-Altiarchaeales-1]|nr:MAG: hypothetical protein CVT88_05880 [Candidatus Altiarchaeales archaeon HGW-Altiarchaeales-1]